MSGITLPLFEVNLTYNKNYWVNLIVNGDCVISILIFKDVGVEDMIFDKDSILYDFK